MEEESQRRGGRAYLEPSGATFVLTACDIGNCWGFPQQQVLVPVSCCTLSLMFCRLRASGVVWEALFRVGDAECRLWKPLEGEL